MKSWFYHKEAHEDFFNTCKASDITASKTYNCVQLVSLMYF